MQNLPNLFSGKFYTLRALIFGTILVQRRHLMIIYFDLISWINNFKEFCVDNLPDATSF